MTRDTAINMLFSEPAVDPDITILITVMVVTMVLAIAVMVWPENRRNNG
jgi:hypothetical protein